MINIPLVRRQSPRVLYDLYRLTSDTLLQETYCKDLEDRMISIQPSTDPNKALADILNCVKKSAETTIGTIPTNKATRYCQDHLVASLSEEQKQLHLRIEACNDSNTQKELRKPRTCKLRQLNRRLREVACQKSDQLARDIASTDDSRRMFKAVQAIKSTKLPPPQFDCSHQGWQMLWHRPR